MQIKDTIALVTGANGGIGKYYIEALRTAGAGLIYACDRKPESVADIVAIAPDRIIAVPLDIINEQSVNAAAAKCQDVTLLINNAGVALNYGEPVTASDITSARNEMEVNYFGTLLMCRAFAPILKQNGGGSLVNVLSILARVTAPVIGSYCASKAAALALTQGVRAELAAQGTLVIAVMPGTVDTEMSKDYPPPKVSPTEVAEATLQAVIDEVEEVYPGEQATQLAAQLLQEPKAAEKSMAILLPTT